MTSHKIESEVQLRVDYREKEEAVLRSIVALVPNRAMLAMQRGSAAAAAPLTWNRIFSQSLAMGNSRSSISPELATRMGLGPAVRRSNSGDRAAVATAITVFSEINPLNLGQPALITAGSGVRASGVQPNAGYPPLLNFRAGTAGASDFARDLLYPIISDTKEYGNLATGRVGLVPGRTPGAPGLTPGTDYARFNSLLYPQINFGYGTPGQAFVAKRNWWAFSLNLANQDAVRTGLAEVGRDFVLSIYEIPSQLPISSAAFTQLGTTTGQGGGDWTQDSTIIDGTLFTGRAVARAPALADGATVLSSLASRGSVASTPGAIIGGAAMTAVAMGDRESFQITRDARDRIAINNNATMGSFAPVSTSADSGRCAFIPISVGETYYDRFLQPDFAFDKYNPNPAYGSLSSTAWNDYSIGARQCAMQLDITNVFSSIAPINLNTTGMVFSYLVGGVRVPLAIAAAAPGNNFINVNPTVVQVNCGNTPTTFRWGPAGAMREMKGLVGNVVFDYATFPGPAFGAGTILRQVESAFETQFSAVAVPGSQYVKVWPERIPAMLSALGADPTSINHSLVVNVNYTGVGPTIPLAPAVGIPGREPISAKYNLILTGCEDLTAFPRGFSLVTNMNLNLYSRFNQVPYATTNLPLGYVPAVTTANPDGLFWPPCSLFAPSKTIGKDTIPLSGYDFEGQLNSLKFDDGTNAVANQVQPLASIAVTGLPIVAANKTANLRQKRHPIEIPPVTMMNWLILLEERRREY